jgi:hypothetical protein
VNEQTGPSDPNSRGPVWVRSFFALVVLDRSRPEPLGPSISLLTGGKLSFHPALAPTEISVGTIGPPGSVLRP